MRQFPANLCTEPGQDRGHQDEAHGASQVDALRLGRLCG